MGHHRLPGAPDIDVTLRRSGRARRLSLRVSQLDGKVTLTMPTLAPLDQALGFLRAKEDWLRTQMTAIAPQVPVGIGQIIPFQDNALPIVAGAGRPRIADGEITVQPKRPAAPQVKGLLRHAARDALADASDRHAGRLGVRYGRLTLRDTRSRWGSCTAQGALMYSWRLIMAPSAVLNYVAAHEVSHLIEMNHGPGFWAIVGRLCPDYARHRDWLRRDGAALHRYCFDD